MRLIDSVKNKLKKIATDGRYIMYEINNIMEDIFSMPFLYDEKNMLDGNILDCCNRYLDYISKEDKIAIIKGNHNKYYKTVVEKKFFSILEVDDVILAYDKVSYSQEDILHMYNDWEGMFNEENNTYNRKRRVKRDISSYATPTGTISLLDVRNELGMGGQIDMNNPRVRQLAGRPSGQIAMSDLRGKSLQTVYTLTIGLGSGSDYNSIARCGYSRQSSDGFGAFSPITPDVGGGYITMISAVFLKGSVAGAFFGVTSTPYADDPSAVMICPTANLEVAIDGVGTYRLVRTYTDGSPSYPLPQSFINFLRYNNGRVVTLRLRWYD